MPLKPRKEYAPRQRGAIAAQAQLKGTKYFHDGDITYEECPNGCGALRVRRKRSGPIMLECLCGYEIEATNIDKVPMFHEQGELEIPDLLLDGPYEEEEE
jgi:hypothetical protein